MPNIQLAKNLQTLRRSKNLTQEYLGKYLNITHQAYSNYEQCQRSPDIDTLVRISNLYQVTLDQLVNTNIRFTPTEGVRDETVPYYVTTGKSSSSGDVIFLSDEEVAMLMDYRELSEDARKMIHNFIKSQKQEIM